MPCRLRLYFGYILLYFVIFCYANATVLEGVLSEIGQTVDRAATNTADTMRCCRLVWRVNIC